MSESVQLFPQLSKLGASAHPPATFNILKAASDPGVISLAMGLPDPLLLPYFDLQQSAERVLRSGFSLQYTATCLPLKEKICKYMGEKGLRCSPEEVLITNGAQQGIWLTMSLLLDYQGAVLEEELTYPCYRQIVDSFAPVVSNLPVNLDHGLDVPRLRVHMLNGAAAKNPIMYLMPTAHNPLGSTLSLLEREEVGALVREFRIPTIEDDPYSDLFYGPAPPPPLKVFGDNWIYYIGSFSKTLGPSFRVGWVIASTEHIQRLGALKDRIDLNVSSFSQWVINDYLERNDFSAHLLGLRAAYKRRRDAMVEALSEWMPKWVRWKIPQDGVFMWVTLPGDLDVGNLLLRCLGEEQVGFLPGNVCSREEKSNGMRLNFSHCDSNKIHEGVYKISQVLGRTGRRSA